MLDRSNTRIGVASVLAWSSNSYNRDLCSLHRGFQALGCTSFHVRPGSIDGTIVEGLVPTSLELMHRESTWKELGCDLAITNTWGSPAHSDLICAIRSSGATTIARLDTHGYNSPWCGFLQYGAITHSIFREHQPAALSAFKAFIKTAVYTIPRVYDLKMLDHLGLADVIGIESEGAKQLFSRLLLRYGRQDLLKKLQVIRHPVVPEISAMSVPDTQSRDRRIVAVGRWASHQKDAPLLIKTLHRSLIQNQSWTAVLCGSGEEVLNSLCSELPNDVRQRIQVTGPLPHAEILQRYSSSRICLFASRYEGCPIAGEEALCLGCSLVGPPDVPSMHDLASPCFGTLAKSRRPADMAAAVQAEIAGWEAGQRIPMEIAHGARSLFAAESVCREILKNTNIIR